MAPCSLMPRNERLGQRDRCSQVPRATKTTNMGPVQPTAVLSGTSTSGRDGGELLHHSMILSAPNRLWDNCTRRQSARS